jgi:hypothetical protein
VREGLGGRTVCQLLALPGGRQLTPVTLPSSRGPLLSGECVATGMFDICTVVYGIWYMIEWKSYDWL